MFYYFLRRPGFVTEHVRFHVIETEVGIRVERHLYVGMAHDVFQLRRVHALVHHLRAEGMAADMGRDLRKLLLIDVVVLRHRVLKILLPVQGDAEHLVLIEEQEAAYPVDHGFARRAQAVRENTLEARGDGVRHGDVTDTALCLRTLYVIAHIAGALELLVHPYAALFEVEIIHREAAELGNAEPGVQEGEEGVVIALIVLVVRREL